MESIVSTPCAAQRIREIFYWEEKMEIRKVRNHRNRPFWTPILGLRNSKLDSYAAGPHNRNDKQINANYYIPLVLDYATTASSLNGSILKYIR